MDIEFLYAMLNNLDELEDKADEIATSLSVTRTTLKQMIEYIEENFEEVDDEPEGDIVVSFYDALS